MEAPPFIPFESQGVVLSGFLIRLVVCMQVDDDPLSRMIVGNLLRKYQYRGVSSTKPGD